VNRWHRNRLREQIPDLIAKWEPEIGETVAHWGIKKMKTRWGSCNAGVRRIWVNLALAKKPPGCLEYILVHEMVHFFERRRGRVGDFVAQGRVTNSLFHDPSFIFR